MSKDDLERLVAVMRSYERKTTLPHYNMWGKATTSYNFKVEELKLVTKQCAEASKPEMLALDAGCGYGVYSSMLSKKGYNVVALDVSAGMLQKTRELAGNDNVWLVRGSLTHLPVKKSMFDLVLCIDTLQHFTDSFLSKALDEFRRTIKSGGVFITDTRNALNPVLSLQYWLKNKEWAKLGGLTLKARSLRSMKNKMSRHNLKIEKTKSIGFVIPMLAPYLLIVSKAV